MPNRTSWSNYIGSCKIRMSGCGTFPSLVRISLFLVICIFCQSCSEEGGGANGPVVYPASWPIASFRTPQGSVAAELKASKRIFGGVTLSNSDSIAVDSDPLGPRIWVIGFHYPGEWQDAISEIENGLSEYNVEVSNKEANERLRRNQCKDYIIRDMEGAKYNLQVIHFGQDGGYYWHMSIIEGNWPAPR